MKSYDIVIAGAGFAGIYAAWRLARDGARVALVEAAEGIGGNLRSKEWNGYWLDNGTHNFDLRTSQGQAFYPDILGDNIQVFEDQKWASITGQTWTYGFESPDWSADPQFCAQVLQEFDALNAQDQGHGQGDYASWHLAQYGPSLNARVMPLIAKFTGGDPRCFDAEARSLFGAFTRVKLGNDTQMIALKEKSPFHDDRLSVTLDCGDARFLGHNVNCKFAYPARQGLMGFCIAADARLRQMGVDIFTGTPITQISEDTSAICVTAGAHNLQAAKLFWSLPEVPLTKILGLDVDLMKIAIPVGTCFFAFEVQKDKVLGPDYAHDFNPDRLTFRYNCAGIYSQQTKPDGQTFVTCEVPCHPSQINQTLSSENQARAWGDLRASGFLAADASYGQSTSWGHPVAYTIPKQGWRPTYEAAQTQIQNRFNRLFGIEFGHRGRLSFMNFYENKLQDLLKA
jgi:hypothetical protein